MTRVLAVRLDSDGDVLLTGPAVRALAATAGTLDVLASPAGAGAAALLPGVADVLVFDPPWSGYAPPAVDAAAVEDLVATLRARRYDRAVVFTSFHQSPLPAALVLRLAGVAFVAGTSADYPGSLLDVRHHRPDGLHEVEAALDLAVAAGGALPHGDAGRLAVRRPLPDLADALPAGALAQVGGGYVVVHPGASVPARAPA
ncbi:glycosyltransferase family 9 protein, partial [Cellulomonas shaoxiangyii]